MAKSKYNFIFAAFNTIAMKNIIFKISLILIIIAGLFSQAFRQAPKTSDIQLTTWKFDSTVKYEGDIYNRNGTRFTVFNVTNTGTFPLKITDVQASCPCITPDWSKEEIAPGKIGFVKLAFMPFNKKGYFIETINVFANTKKGSESLAVRYNVTR